MPKTTFTTSGVLVATDVGKDGQIKGPFPGLTVTAKRTINDVEFSLSVPTHTAAQKQSLNGSLLSLKSNWSESTRTALRITKSMSLMMLSVQPACREF